MPNKLNIIALIAGVATLVLIVVSLWVPWWQFNVGQPAIAQVNFSPVNLDFSLLGNSLSIPIIWAVNLACILTLASGGIVMLVYSVLPNKPYSKKLLGFGYKKPLYAVIFFVVEIVALVLLANMLGGMSVPFSGAGIMTLPQGMAPGGVSISVSVLAAFEWPFYLAVVVAGLCVAARLYHRKIPLETSMTPPPPPPPP